MRFDDFLELVKTRRSIRRWKLEPVSDDSINKILESARWAMSGANAQPWEFLIIRDKETKRKMAEAFRRYDEMIFISEQTRLEEYRHHSFRGKQHNRNVPWEDAPVIICVLGDQRTIMASTMFFGYFDHRTFDHNMANVTQMICLSAAALGLGAQWVSVHQPLGEELKNILGIPPVIRVFTLVPVGYAAVQPIPYRRELNELVHHETYDISLFRSQSDLLQYVKNVRQRRLTSL